jgi:hypothetical protein
MKCANPVAEFRLASEKVLLTPVTVVCVVPQAAKRGAVAGAVPAVPEHRAYVLNSSVPNKAVIAGFTIRLSPSEST